MTREEFSKQIEAINPKLAILFHCPVMFHYTARLELARNFDALLREARSEGAQVERAECEKAVEAERLQEELDNDEDRAYNHAIDDALRAVRERGNQADEKAGE